MFEKVQVPLRETTCRSSQVHPPATKTPRTSWSTAASHVRRLFHVACSPRSPRRPIRCHVCRRRACQPVSPRRQRPRRPRRRRLRRCTRRTVSTTSCRSTAASSPPAIDHPASPGTAMYPARSADRNAPSARRVFKSPGRSRLLESGTTPGRGGSKRCRSPRVSHRLSSRSILAAGCNEGRVPEALECAEKKVR